MRTLEEKATAATRHPTPLFKKENGQHFFGTNPEPESFFQTTPTAPSIQPKLSVGRPDDPYEKEADAMADKVVQRLHEPDVVQAKCTECEEEESKTEPLKKAVNEPEPLEYYGNQALRTLHSAPRSEEEKTVQKKEQKDQTDGIDYLNSDLSEEINQGGQAISPALLGSMQQTFGTDFDHVRIHDNSDSHALSDRIHAKAFTYKNHIFFNRGQYHPASSRGKHLLAHELTHTIQQGAGKSAQIQRRIGDGHDFPVASRFSRNVILEAVFDNERVVESGSRGAHVTLVQQALISLNYPLPTFGADGMFGDETRRAVRAFQQDVGLGVDGRVGFRTIDFLDKRDRNAEVAPPARPVLANVPFNTNNAIVQPGAAPSNALTGCQYGLTFPENVQVRIDLVNNAGTWQPVLSEVVGNYSLQFRLVPGQAEVTGPAGNTTAANYCAQITELNRLGNCPGGAPPATWFMLSAVLAHERVHATRFLNALIHPSVIAPLETAIEGITRPAAGLLANPLIAEFFIRGDPAFTAALTAAQTNWLARILVLAAGDHGAGSPTHTAEHAVVDPMVRRICRHARRNGWPACPPLCP